MSYTPTGRPPGRPRADGSPSAAAKAIEAETPDAGSPPVEAPSAAAPVQPSYEDLAAEVARLRARNDELTSEKIDAFVPTANHNEGFAGYQPILDDSGEPKLDRNGDPMQTEMWHYRVDLPPSGGSSVVLNGIHYYHGEMYKVSVHVLRTLKDIVARTWTHEAQIKGSNENFYRRPTERTLRGTGR